MIRILAALLVLYAGAASAQGRDSARVYVFGNSLVHHQSETSDHTNVPHWMNQMARADGRSLALDGQWGFLRNFADSLPPTANWSFPGVQGAWSPGQGPFRDGRYDAVIATPANFIQYQLPDVPYDGDNPDGESPLGALQRIFDWVEVNSPGTRLFVYEGWSDMASFSRNFPPSNRQLRRYHDFNAGEYHQWYRDLLNVMSVTRPDTQVEVIPVASILAGFFQRGGLLEGLPAEALYTDNAPHGTPTLYMLAAMVTYAWIYDAPPPDGFSPPETLHPDVVANYAQLAEAIWQQVPQREAAAPAPGRPAA